MKNSYKSFICLLLTICVILISLQTSYAQCPDGQPARTAYDMTIVFETGPTSFNINKLTEDKIDLKWWAMMTLISVITMKLK